MHIRRALCFAFLVPFLFLFGCSSSGPVKPESLQLTIDSTAEIRTDGERFDCRICHDRSGRTEIRYTDPGGVLDGLCFLRKNGESVFRYGDLEHRILPGSLPGTHLPEKIAAVLDQAQAWETLKAEGDCLSGRLPDGTPFRIYAERNGTITRLLIDNIGEVSFHNTDSKVSME